MLLSFHSLLKGGLLSVDCWGPTTDTVIFEFYCDSGAGCDTDVQFWYRLTPSPIGEGEESLNELLFAGLLRDLLYQHGPHLNNNYYKNKTVYYSIGMERVINTVSLQTLDFIGGFENVEN